MIYTGAAHKFRNTTTLATDGNGPKFLSGVRQRSLEIRRRKFIEGHYQTGRATWRNYIIREEQARAYLFIYVRRRIVGRAGLGCAR